MATVTQIQQLDSRSLAIISIIYYFLVTPLDVVQLSFVLLGACSYAAWRSFPELTSLLGATVKGPYHNGKLPQRGSARIQEIAFAKVHAACDPSPPADVDTQTPTQGASAATWPRFLGTVQAPPSLSLTRTYSPVTAPTFQGQGLEAEVREFLDCITPTAASEQIVEQMADNVKAVLRARGFDALEVSGLLNTEFDRGTPYGSAVPDVDLVVNIHPAAMAQMLDSRNHQRHFPGDMNVRKVEKAALRWFTNILVSAGKYKFRRSSFKAEEPKVTLLAIEISAGAASEPVPFDLYINSTMPLYSAVLMMEFGQVDVRGKELALLVRRWVKARAICHAPKGHLSPYAWLILTIYFLQVGVSPRPVLPPLLSLRAASSLTRARGESSSGRPWAARGPSSSASAGRDEEHSAAGAPVLQQSTAVLFKEFIRFYARCFDWARENVSINLGTRSSPSLDASVNILASNVLGPNIEDPFDKSRSLTGHMTMLSVGRLREEFSRADALLSDAAVSLTDLLKPWVPPGVVSAEDSSSSSS